MDDWRRPEMLAEPLAVTLQVIDVLEELGVPYWRVIFSLSGQNRLLLILNTRKFSNL
jgi:hypothetical protein